jgi:hypothetical protein
VMSMFPQAARGLSVLYPHALSTRQGGETQTQQREKLVFL